MILFLKLLLAHLLGDFVLQNEKWVIKKREKKVKSIELYYHIGIHFFLLLIVLKFDIQKYWLGLLFITITHYLFDLLKLYVQRKSTKLIWFFFDQFLHVIIITLTTIIYHNVNINLDYTFSKKSLLLIISLVLVTYVSAVIIKVIISEWIPKDKQKDDESLAKAGRYIGIIERILIFTFILINQWELIGFLIAAKSFRFSGLNSIKKRNLTEYYFIGTLLSFGLAIIIGILYSYFLTII